MFIIKNFFYFCFNNILTIKALDINKRKIINDPLYGFFNLQSELVFDLIEHPYFQRLRRIKQLGLTYLVFPGANHSRFEHALGAAFLMRQAIAGLKNKGHNITDEEAEAVDFERSYFRRR